VVVMVASLLTTRPPLCTIHNIVISADGAGMGDNSGYAWPQHAWPGRTTPHAPLSLRPHCQRGDRH
jgi:hypothetical protein